MVLRERVLRHEGAATKVPRPSGATPRPSSRCRLTAGRDRRGQQLGGAPSRPPARWQRAIRRLYGAAFPRRAQKSNVRDGEVPVFTLREIADSKNQRSAPGRRNSGATAVWAASQLRRELRRICTIRANRRTQRLVSFSAIGSRHSLGQVHSMSVQEGNRVYLFVPFPPF
jgi:hypothetical protein